MKKIEKPALRLPDGRVIALPEPPELHEFSLPGNFRWSADGKMLAFYDETTKTGATYFATHGTWAMQQPVSREQFRLHCEVMESMPPVEGPGGEMAAGLPADPVKH
jgi:hypothetical protein